MKKIFCIFLALMIIGSTASCAVLPENTTGATREDHTDSEKTDNTTEVTHSEETTKPKRDNTLQVPSKEIYFSFPDDWSYSKETYSTVLMKTDECLIAVCYNWAMPYEGDLEGLIDFFSSGVMRDIAPYSKGYLGAGQISATSTEKVKISGKDSVKFTGTVNNTDWDCHIYGYTMIVSDIPMMVIGLVSTIAQDPQMIAQIDALTDQVAASVRTEK